MKLGPLPAYQRWTCRACGRCCRGLYSVPVSEEEKSAIISQGWEAELPLASPHLFIEQGGGSYLARDACGACVFLTPQGTCRIHARYGESAKPLACRLYPFVLTPVGEEVFVGLRFDCPAVLDNYGKPLMERRAELAALMREVIPSALTVPSSLLFGRGRALPTEQLIRLTEAFDRLISQQNLSFTRRMLACCSLVHLLQFTRIDELRARTDEFIEVSLPVVLKAAETDPLERHPPPRGVMLLFRQFVGLLNRWDRVEDTLGSLRERLRLMTRRLRYSLILTRGKGCVPPLREGFPQVPFSTLEEYFPLTDALGEELLMRFYRMKFGGMDFFGPAYHYYSYLEGARSLLLTFPAVMWTARAFALADGRTDIDERSLSLAIQGVDAQFGRSPAFGFASERRRLEVLSREENLRALITWFGA